MPTSSESPSGPTRAPVDLLDPHDHDAVEEALSDGFPRLSRLNLAFLGLSIVSICSALYLSPAASDVRHTVTDTVRSAVPGVAGPTAAPSATPAASPSASPSFAATRGGALAALRPSATPGPSAASTGRTTTAAVLAPRTYTGTGSSATGWRPSAAAPPAVPTPTPVTKPVTTKKKTKCWQFTWQQDAQKVYVANLSDPYGLDAGAGPGDGDGLACSDLPVDPSRAASVPAGAYEAPKPSVATKARLVSPSQDYFGFSQDGVPGDTAMLRSLADRAGKAPSSVGWFSSFDDTYRADLVERSWAKGALPVITWMPVASTSGTSYSLTSIINGSHDAYLRRFAGDVVRENLPVALRFAHEMNGSWYGWSAGRTDYNNTPAKYVAAWRHVWQVFDEVGATDDVIWLWSPSRVDALHPSATNGLTDLSADYPGDAYVDWVGASVYLRSPTDGATYDTSFGQTVSALEAVTDKPIFFAETAAAQTTATGADATSIKAAWTTSVLQRLATDPRVVGFLWFNNDKPTVVNGVEVTNDWRFDSSTGAAAAFRAGIADDDFAAGVDPD